MKNGFIRTIQRRIKTSLFSDEDLKIIFKDRSLSQIHNSLSYHGLIPEVVHEVTSACFTQKKKMFETKLGFFSYTHSPVSPFFQEVEKKLFEDL